MHDLLTWVQGLPTLWIYLVAALIVAGETAVIFGLLVPGEATLLLVGFLTYNGTLRLGPALLAMIVAAVLGDGLAFRAGRRYGPRLRAGLGHRVGPQRWARADAMLARLGGRGVFAARWVAFARTLVPRLAGAADMPYRRFALWNLAGVATWVSGSVLLGHLAGESYDTVSRLLGRATGVAFLLLAGLLGVVLVGRWLGRNPDPVRALLSRAGAVPPVRWLTARYGVLFFLVAMRIGPAWTLLLNLAAGLLLLFAAGLAIAGLLAVAVRNSGLAALDGAIAGWFAARRTPDAADATLVVVSVVRGSVLILLVAVVAAVLAWRNRPWRTDLLSVVGTVGAFVPLVVLAVVAEVTGPNGTAPGGGEVGPLSTQNAVVAASFCTLAWLVSRGAHWPVAVAAWTTAAAGVLGIGGARLYLGLETASGTAAAVLLGVLWTVVFMVAWATRDRAVGDGQPPVDQSRRPSEGHRRPVEPC
ncbi:DedA family protein [Micromonospora ureilytica]|uniref:Undecaprenyl-diphosphatase n=1 Tax=Micromonospora ureilytica TaxID=709868 RepID=A0ABS0JCF7_9ACTN|nr:DedA family protein [Micromonospora ureilytica]MBG6064211.1 undecaprenyl-diphosphatase [Micromonospora ureilytica]WSR56121.1 DedA family protein [Micromonospora ureilytica]